MINRVVLVGRLTRDPELRKTTQSATAVTSFTIAVDNRTKSPTGEKTASFIPCIAWRETAELVARYVHKGSLVGVEGRLQQRSYVSKDGRNVSVLEVVCDSVQFLEPKSANAGNPIPESIPTPMEEKPSENNKNLTSVDVTDDDLPF